MKKVAVVFVVLVALIISLFFIRIKYLDIKERDKNSEKLIGVYIFDTEKTALGRYAKDSSKFNKLLLTFYPDHTFKFNMNVPFIFLNAGTWEAAGADLDEWNKLDIDGNSFAQVSTCCSVDSTIMLNSTTPKDGEYLVQQIYFKKIHPKPGDIIW